MGLDEPRNDPLIFAYYVTGHGFGHATRVVEVSVCEFLYIYIYLFFFQVVEAFGEMG